jgi:hypothetical protein
MKGCVALKANPFLGRAVVRVMLLAVSSRFEAEGDGHR